MFSSAGSRQRHISTSNSSTSFLSGVCDRVGGLGCDIRSFVLLVGLIILLANVILLVQLNPYSGEVEHRPNGGPIEGSDIGTHGQQSPQSHGVTNLIKNRLNLANLLRDGKTNGPIPITTTPTTTTPLVDATPIPPTRPLLSPTARTEIWSKAGQNQCDQQFGNGFSQSTSLCGAGSGSSKLTCNTNPITRGMTCAGENILVDLNLMRVAQGGEPIESVRGRREDDEFVVYQSGAFELNCPRPTDSFRKDQFPHHLGDMFQSIGYAQPSNNWQNDRCQQWIHAPTLFITRYEYANLYHSLGDFYNTYQTQWMYGLDDTNPAESAVHVVFFDGHSAGALDEVWTKLFGSHVTYVKGLPKKYSSQGSSNTRFCFSKAYFVSPAYKSALGVDMMIGSNGCGLHPCLTDFADVLLDKYDMNNVNPWSLFPLGGPSSRDLFGREILPKSLDLTKTPLVTMIFRKDYLAHPRLSTLAASRKVANEAAVGEVLGRLPNAHAIGVDFAKLSVAQQLVLIRYSTVLVGIHGAGLSYTVALSSGAALFELVPPEYSGRPHFKYFAQWSDHHYSSLSVSGEQAGNGHQVDTAAFENELKTILSVPQPRLITPPPGWFKAFRPTSSLPGPMRTQSLETSYTPGMIDEKRPADWTSIEVDPKSDHGEDLGPSQNDGHRLCIIVPFRDSKSLTSQGAGRTANLMQMIPHMINHLEKGGMKFIRDFEVIVSEQTDGLVFNKGALFNVGYIQAKRAGCDYLVLHDVDQVPTSPNNKYKFPKDGPVHLCSASSQYGYNMAYGTMVGGALLLTTEAYEKVNGYSNFYWGWGQEDDDFYYRLAMKFGNVQRLSVEDGRYEALSHPRVKDLDVTPVFREGTAHLTATRTGQFDIMTDGISNLKYELLAIERWPEWPRGVRKFVADLRFDNMPKDLNGRQETKN